MGYDKYQQNLIYRHLDQEGSWDSHLTSSRNFILKAIDFYKPETVTLLGSGWLLDVPLKEISENARFINLVDIVHPPEVKSQAAGIKNVILRDDDVSGGLILNTWEKAGKRFFFNKLKSIDEIVIPEYHPQFETGLVISLNILTQLEFLPAELLRKKSRATEEDILRFRRKIQESHLLFLKKHNSVLITDVSEVISESTGKIQEVKSVLTDLPEGRADEEWTWNFEQRNSDYYNKRSVFRVAARLY